MTRNNIPIEDAKKLVREAAYKHRHKGPLDGTDTQLVLMAAECLLDRVVDLEARTEQDALRLKSERKQTEQARGRFADLRRILAKSEDKVAALEAKLERIVTVSECLSEAAEKHLESGTADGVAAASSVVLTAAGQDGETK